jgi:hypothetical protein
MNFSGSVSYRPVRIGFLVPPDDLSSVVRAARLSACLWGGRYNPIIPFFEDGGERWKRHYSTAEGVDIARGFIDFFEPDVLVENAPGMAKKIGWSAKDSHFRMPRVVQFDNYYKVDYRNEVQFSAGIDILEVIEELYHNEFRFEQRRKQPFAKFGEAAGDAFFDVVGGRYPTDDALSYIAESYEDVFSPETLPPDSSTALRQLKEGLFGPLWITRHELEESLGRGFRDETLYLFDPKDAGDVIDYWNFRLVEQRTIPINVNWLADFASFMRDHITAVHRPIPGNPFGTKFHTNICFSSSINEKRQIELIQKHFLGLPDGAFYTSSDPLLWHRQGRGRERRESKILATGKAVSFDEEAQAGTSTKVPSPSPSFLNRSGRYRKSRWMNVIVPSNSLRGDNPAIVYPANLWSPDFPRLAMGDLLRVGREGWILQSEYTIGYSLLSLQVGRDAIISWFKTQGIEAKPSEEGQIATQIITAAGGLLPSGMFADRATLNLLGEMAESHAETSRNGRKVAKATPDRSKHINTIRQHFDAREKRSFGYWSRLEYFLERSVFRAGVRVQCPICAYKNWIDLNALSYRPTCARCLNEFAFSQKPADLQKVDWFYRVVGPFTAPDFARGAYSVALTLRTLADPHDTEMTWSTGLSLSELNCEVDFIAWHRAGRTFNDERDEPLLVIGEAKSFGRNAINDDAVAALRTVAERFPGSVMVVSVLRDAGDLSLAEIGRLRRLALWGRRSRHEGQPINSLIVLTGAELFAEHGIAGAWRKIDGKEMHPMSDLHNLHTLSELTIGRYLGLGSHWGQTAAGQSLPAVGNLLGLVRGRGIEA